MDVTPRSRPSRRPPAPILTQSPAPAPVPAPRPVPAPEPEPALKAAPVLKRERSKQQILLIAMACLIFGFGLFVSIQSLLTNRDAKTQVTKLSHQSDNANGNDAVPSETKPSNGNYQVAPLLPKYIKIAKLGVDARIKPLGVTSQNELQAPTNIYDTGWYNASARPGDPAGNGAVLIDGHVHGPTAPGVFVNLKTLVAGDMMQIVRGDNQIFQYKVVKVQNYDAKTLDMAMMLTSIKAGSPGLNLITCGGKFDKVSNSYTQRTAVFAIQI